MTYWIRTKTNRLKLPTRKKLESVDISGTTVNWCGEPVAKVGDYVYMSGATVSAGTVGRVLSLKDYGTFQPGYEHWWSAEVETLSGKINSGWLWTLSVLPYNAVQEVKDFYIVDGRPERIKVSW
jgi:hypothetical protein